MPTNLHEEWGDLADIGSEATPTASIRRGPGVIVRRPAVGTVVFIIIGICVAPRLAVMPGVLLAVAVAAAVGGIGLRQWGLAASVMIGAGLAALGAAVAQESIYSYRADDIGAFSSAEAKLAQLELRIEEPPRIVGGGVRGTGRQMFEGSVQRILTGAGWVRASGRILVQVTHPHPFLGQGQAVRVLGMLERPAHATNPGEFDWAEYYRGQRILTSIKIGRISNIQILSDEGPGVIGWMRGWARDWLAMGFTDKHAGDQAMLRALVLGDSEAMMRESQTQFQKIGVAYLLSVSGMHIAVVAGVVYGICRLLMRSPRFACWMCLGVVILYGLVALPGEAGLRAVLLCGAIVLGILFRRDVDKLQLLAIVGCVLVLMSPMEVFGAGFQLGFVCILGLILFGGRLIRWLGAHDYRNDTGGIEPVKSVWGRGWLWLRGWVAISFVAWMISLPLVAYHFGQLSPWSIPDGIVLFPVVAVALMGGCAKILLTLAWPSLAGGWASCARLPIVGMRRLAALLAHLPAASVPATRPSVVVILIYYGVLSLVLIPWPKLWLRRGSVGLATAAVCCLVASLSLGFTLVPSNKRDTGVSITFLDIGAGQCAVMEVPGEKAVMLDAGSSTVSDVTRSCLGPFLTDHGERTVGAVVLSHSDFDHISAVTGLLPTFGIGAVYTSHYFSKFASIDPPAQGMLDQLKGAGKSPHFIGRGDHLQVGRDVVIDVLWPPENCEFNCNNTGLVYKVCYGGRTVLFPADIQVDAMRALLKNRGELKADVLVAAHHGSSEVTTPAFVAAVDPQFIVSSNGSPLTAKQKLFEREIGGRRLYRTSGYGAITVHLGAEGKVWVETFGRKD